MYCGRCGEALDAGAHERCAAALRLEPPRFCSACRRRMKVQVTPMGWTATCVAHGDLRSRLEAPGPPAG
ncbi:hypothetical protein G9U51_15890 [Calidifontibacter sp. DB0510]|uniref:Biotin synthase auxiliary protein n=1 Tax=Metallococcus carri TaxID=1656884 RepID=A0A967B1T5_9MICO|nr:hypothetical protein [Metallococcus carri]NOP37943.1 hypothetical protein [Calidifontibacter sp. DB2511S]